MYPNNLIQQNYMNNLMNVNMFNKFNPANMNQMQINNMTQTFENLKRNQQAKLLSKLHDLERNKGKLKLSKDELVNAIIKPLKIEKVDHSEKIEILNKTDNLKKQHTDKERKELWKKRTNQGYKHIIKNKQHMKDDYKKQEDLIVHKVTNEDKLGVKEDHEKFVETIEKHNDELKIVYSQNKELEHKKKFEYNNKYKYTVKFNPKSHDELKDNNLEYFKSEQEKAEHNKKKIDTFINDILNTNILSDKDKSELKTLNIIDENSANIQKDNTIDDKKVVIIKNKEIIDNNKIIEPVKINKPIEINEPVENKTKIIFSVKSVSSEEKIDTSINDEIRNKYKKRQK